MFWTAIGILHYDLGSKISLAFWQTDFQRCDPLSWKMFQIWHSEHLEQRVTESEMEVIVIVMIPKTP
jgi:hypothetical protein